MPERISPTAWSPENTVAPGRAMRRSSNENITTFELTPISVWRNKESRPTNWGLENLTVQESPA